MSRYADATVCPDCRQPIEYGAPRCTHCDLPLTGMTAVDLFRTLQRADALVAQLRAQASTPQVAPTVPGQQPTTAPVHRPRLTSASVPKILLCLGAACLLVAALVFLAVAWSALGIGGRTAVLLGCTGASASLALLMVRRSLRAGAEAFCVVALGLLALDLSGADRAGWLGDLPDGGLAMLLGTLTAVAGALTAAWARRTPVTRLVGAEMAAALGLAVALAGLVDSDLVGDRPAIALATLVTAAAAVGSWRGALVFLAGASTISATCWWLALVVTGLNDAVRDATVAALWGDGRIWPLLAATAIAALPTCLPRLLPLAARVGCAGAAGVVGAMAATVPTYDSTLSQTTIAWLAVLAVATLLMRTAPGRWGWAALAPALPAAVVVGGTALALSGSALERLLDEGRVWSVPADHLLPSAPDVAHPLLLLPCVALLAVALWATALLAGLDRATPPVVPSTSTCLWVLAALLMMAAAGCLTLYPAPLWSVVVALLAVTVGLVGAARMLDQDGWYAVAAALAAGTLLAALPSDWLTLGTLVTVALVAGFVDLTGRGVVGQLAAGTTMAAIGAALWTGGHLAQVDEDWRVALVIAVLGLLSVARPEPAYEITGWVTAFVPLAATTHDVGWLAVHLALAGALVTGSSLVHAHRRPLGWVGAGLFTAALWAWLWDLRVDTVEWYTLPLAGVVLGFGLWRLWQGSEELTLRLLTPGLVLATVPSLVLVLVDPVSTRALLLGLGCAALVVLGVWLRWGSPLLVGATVGGVEVLRQATYADVLPQWVLIALLGALFTVIGVTWERRLAELRLAAGYVRDLR